jgi:hypothetical protein
VSNTGQEFTTFIDCRAWGRKAEAASEIAPDALGLFKGKLKRQKQGERWKTMMSGFELTVWQQGLPQRSANTV